MDKIVTYFISSIGLIRKAITIPKISNPNNICMIFTNLFFMYKKIMSSIIPTSSVLSSTFPAPSKYNPFPMKVSRPLIYWHWQ